MSLKIQEALRHVKSLYPEVVQVQYDASGRWLYTDAEGRAPAFGPSVDISLLEDAAAEAEGNSQHRLSEELSKCLT